MFEDFQSWPEFAGIKADLEAHAGMIREEAVSLCVGVG